MKEPIKVDWYPDNYQKPESTESSEPNITTPIKVDWYPEGYEPANTLQNEHKPILGGWKDLGEQHNLSYEDDNFSERVNQSMLTPQIPTTFNLSSLEKIAQETFKGTGSEEYGDSFDSKFEQRSADTSLKGGANAVKNVVAGGIAGIPDIAVQVYNALKNKDSPKTELIADRISHLVDTATLGYTKDASEANKHFGRFLGMVFTPKILGKPLEMLSNAVPSSKILEKTAKGVKHLGFNEVNPHTASAAVAGAGVEAVGHDELPASLLLPLQIAAMAVGGKIPNTFNNDLFNKSKAVSTYFDKHLSKEIIKDITPEAIENTLRNAIYEKETEFLSQKVLSELSPEVREKVTKSPYSLSDEEMKGIIEKSTQDYFDYFGHLEKKYDLPLSLEQLTESPKLKAKADSYANKQIEDFDLHSANQKRRILANVEKIQSKIQDSPTNKESIGETIGKEVESIYKNAEGLRRENWNKVFGKVSEEPLFELTSYRAKLKEFNELPHDNLGNEIASNVAKKRLEALEYAQKVSPKRFNDILVGLTEKVRSLGEGTFSRKQISELKGSLLEDLETAIQTEVSSGNATLIKKAREQYRADSEFIEQLNDSFLFSKIDQETLTIPERITKALEKMEVSQLRLTMEALKRSENYGIILPQLQRYYIENALTKATAKGVENFNVNLFIKSLPEKEARQIIFSEDQQKNISELMSLMNKIAHHGAKRGGSPTAQRAMLEVDDFSEIVSKAPSFLAKNLFKEVWKDSFGKAGTNYSKRSQLIIDPKHREHILSKVGKTNPNSPNLAAIIAQLKENL